MLTLQVLNTKGAARRLGCSETWIHKLAATGKLKAYIYGNEGKLVEHEKVAKKPGRPRGSKNRYPSSNQP